MVRIIELHKKYNTKAKCIDLLEKLRWGKVVKCPYCGCNRTRPNKHEVGRHTCKNRKCLRSFTVLVGTIFESSRLPLPKWFSLIALTLNAKGGISAKEVQRNLGSSYKSIYYALMRIRVGMLQPDTQLNGMIEMDESYFTSSEAKIDKSTPDNEANLAKVDLKRGRGSQRKISVAGMVQRKGQVKTKVLEKLTKRNLLAMLKKYASNENSILVTDGFKSYKALEEYIDRLVIDHSKSFSKGIVHVNTIEGYWSFVKNGIRGSYKSISKKYLPFYLVEYEWKYNHRLYKGDQFEAFLKNALGQEKELEYWKAKSSQQVKQIAYEN
jgi:transposase-like protein